MHGIIKYSGVMFTLLSTLSSETLMAAGQQCFTLKNGHASFQLGGFWANPGNDQNINIKGLVGNHYSVRLHNSSKLITGLYYYLDGFHHEKFELTYGMNAFYLGPNSVSGNITQEQLFTNLSYRYKIQHIPLYLASKAMLKTNNERYNLTLDAGIGPNFIRTSQYSETPLNVYTRPDNAFSSNNNVTFSATAGVGLRLNRIFGNIPLECGYRFFYLGQGQLASNNNQMINTLQTGNNYANALAFNVTV